MKAILPFIFVLMLPMSAQEIGSTAQGARFIPGSIGPVETAIESHSHSENGMQQQEERAIGRAGLARTVRKAARKAARSGDITFAQRNKIILATIVPATLEKIETAAIMQMSGSGEDTSAVFEYDDDGKINRASIDWDGLIDFIERLLPIILEIIAIFGG